MPLSAGTRLGPYEILALIGAGGMGEVYRARDPRMGREVAIKVSAERFSDRFEREVHAVAALNHPNICHLYDVGPNYLVMELVEGPTLAERIASGAIPLEEALAIARQIAEALEAAHEKRITHRDLKPANVKITPEGVVKVLDFGLAKIADPVAAAPGAPDASPTLTLHEGTRVGVILGTAAYMSPEQASGKPVNKRADIWSFGVVLYEMLTGRMLFDGETVSHIMAAVLTKEPDWNRVPVKVRQLLRSCLEKDPKRRLRDIGDAFRLFENPPLQAAARTRVPWVVAGVLGVGLAIALGALWTFTRPVETSQQPVVRLDLDLGGAVSASNIGTDTILSPDGTRLVFVSQGADGKSHLSARRLDQPKPTELPGTDGADGPFFSPDGLSVGFFAAGKLKKTALDGGDPAILCDAPAGRGATWSEDGKIIAALDAVRGLALIPSAGGQPTSLTELETGEAGHRFPHALPGGKAVLFTFSNLNGFYEEAGIALVLLKDHRRKNILEHAGMNPMYLPSGHLVYVTKGSLFAVPFDAERLELRGEAKPVIEDVANDSDYGSAQVSFSQAGRLIYRAGAGRSERRFRDVLWLSADGRTQALWPEPAIAQEPRVSPDGRRLAIGITNGPGWDLWVYDVDKTTKTRLTSGLAARNPVWSHDGQFIVFQAPGGIFWTRADGAGKPQPLVTSKAYVRPSSFSPEGQRLVLFELLPGGGGAIKTVLVENASGQLRAGQPEIFFQSTATSNLYPRFSHDGHWLAYMDAESGSFEVYVRAFPDRGAKWQISNSGGGFPVWSPNGHELFYRSPDNRIMVVNYGVRGTEFSAEKPRLWSDRRLFNQGVLPSFDLAPDGKRFAVVLPRDGDQPRPDASHVTLLLNFFDEVRRRVAAQGK
jgi:eukaryotic-like serine/threonine-protein kinase